MYKTRGEAVKFIEDLKPRMASVKHCDVVVAPPFTALPDAAEAAKGSAIGLAAQDVHWDVIGARIGDITTSILLDAGWTYVSIGHSEGRQDRGGTDVQVNL